MTCKTTSILYVLGPTDGTSTDMRYDEDATIARSIESIHYAPSVSQKYFETIIRVIITKLCLDRYR